MDKKIKKELFPVIDVSSRKDVKIIYPDYSSDRKKDEKSNEKETGTSSASDDK